MALQSSNKQMRNISVCTCLAKAISQYMGLKDQRPSTGILDLLGLLGGKSHISRAFAHVFTTRLMRARQNESRFGLHPWPISFKCSASNWTSWCLWCLFWKGIGLLWLTYEQTQSSAAYLLCVLSHALQLTFMTHNKSVLKSERERESNPPSIINKHLARRGTILDIKLCI